jgi:beta-phosphoglucomutase family hydrolase
VLGLPASVRACLFDMDGVLTDTARVHAAAWTQMFNEFLQARARQTGTAFVPFDPVNDYDAYVDGRPRLDGTRTFLQSRAIELPEGSPDDPPGTPSVHGLSARKNDLVQQRLKAEGVHVYPGSLDYLRAVTDAGLPRAVVTASANARDVLRAAHLLDLIETLVDGTVVEREHLRGKPAPDTFLAAARALRVTPGEAAVFEDALAGVQAGHDGGFGFVVGVDRTGQAAELRAHGADLVVKDLSELLTVP